MRRLVTACVLTLLPLLLNAQETPADPWSNSIGAGLAVTSGNSDTQNLNFSFTTKYDPKTRFLFKGEALVLRGEANGVQQVDKATAAARGEYTISDRTFGFGEVSYLRDPFKDIDYLVAPVAGVGYRIINTDTRKLSIDGAAGIQVESNSLLGNSTSGAIKGGETLDWALSPTSKLTHKLNGLWKTNDFADALYHLDVGLTTTVATRLELKVAYNYDYKTRPPRPEIEKGDSALFAALLFKF